MDSSVVFWEFLVVALIFTATIIASEFARRWLEKTERDNIHSLTETPNLIATETDYRSCDPHFLIVEEPVGSVPMDSSSSILCVDFDEKGPKYKPITSLEECIRIRDGVAEGSEELKDAAMMALVYHFGHEKAETITLEELESIKSDSSTSTDEDAENIIEEIEE